MSEQDDDIADEFATVTEVRRVWWPGDLYVHGEQPMDPADFWRDLGCTQVIPDHPALISVARWLAEHGEEMLADLVSVGAHEIGDAWNAEQFGDAAYRETVKRAGLALVAALEEGTR